jgi:predicted aconitase with swiveling domain
MRGARDSLTRREENSVEKRAVMRGRSIAEGVAEGEALVTRQFFGFTHGVEPATGRISDERHEWVGKNMRGKVLVFPYGKSSASGALFILEAIRCGNGPAALINLETEPVIGAGFILARIFYHVAIPVVDRLDQNPLEVIKTGDYVRVDGHQGLVEVIQKIPGDQPV